MTTRAARPVLIITAVATSVMGHAIRTGPTALPAHDMWWLVFALASLAAIYAAVDTTRLTVSIAGAACITVFISRALATFTAWALGDTQLGALQRLSIACWLLLAYFGGHVYYRITSRQAA